MYAHAVYLPKSWMLQIIIIIILNISIFKR